MTGRQAKRARQKSHRKAAVVERQQRGDQVHARNQWNGIEYQVKKKCMPPERLFRRNYDRYAKTHAQRVDDVRTAFLALPREQRDVYCTTIPRAASAWALVRLVELDRAHRETAMAFVDDGMDVAGAIEMSALVLGVEVPA